MVGSFSIISTMSSHDKLRFVGGYTPTLDKVDGSPDARWSVMTNMCDRDAVTASTSVCTWSTLLRSGHGVRSGYKSTGAGGAVELPVYGDKDPCQSLSSAQTLYTCAGQCLHAVHRLACPLLL